MDVSKRVGKLFTSEDIDSSKKDYTDEIVVLSPYYVEENFKEAYQAPEYQLGRAIGGFGCDPVSMGRAVVIEFLIDGEVIRYNRGDFLGVLKEELCEEYGITAREEAVEVE